MYFHNHLENKRKDSSNDENIIPAVNKSDPNKPKTRKELREERLKKEKDEKDNPNTSK